LNLRRPLWQAIGSSIESRSRPVPGSMAMVLLVMFGSRGDDWQQAGHPAR